MRKMERGGSNTLPPAQEKNAHGGQKRLMRIIVLVLAVAAAASFKLDFPELFTRSSSAFSANLSGDIATSSEIKDAEMGYATLKHPLIVVLSPTTGEVLQRGKPYVIKWSLQYVPPSAKIDITLVKGGYQLIPLVNGILPTQFGYTWNVGAEGTADESSATFNIVVHAMWPGYSVFGSSGDIEIR